MAGSAIGDVEGDGFGTATASTDFVGQRLGSGQALVGVNDHMQAVTGQLQRDRPADAAAGAGDERSFW